MFFYSGPFSYLGGETTPQTYKIFSLFDSDCFGFWICFRRQKNKKHVSFYFDVFD